MMSITHFAHPGWLWLLLLMPLPAILERARPKITWPSFESFPPRHRIGWYWLRALPALARGLAIGSLAIALAQPQTVGGVTRIAGHGVAIVVALDHSSSMKAADFPIEHGTRLISRLDAAKATLIRFVEGRSDDLIGLVIFANEPDLACPPTLDQKFMIDSVRAVRPARPLEDGTNIGSAIAWATDALLVAPPKKKVLVLLTDGNNDPATPYPPLDPEEAASIAGALGITLHTIAIGRTGRGTQGIDPGLKKAVMPDVEGPNLKLLERLSQLTGGRPFAATDADALDKVFQTIDALEKSPVRGQILTRYDEHYAPWAGLAMGLLILDRLLALGRLRRLP
jgi:Ca-activated chloride channel family protein